jgi:hypothetical protein
VMFENDAYTLAVSGNKRVLELTAASGERLMLSLLSAVDRTDGADETIELGTPELRGGTIVVERRSTLWDRAWLEIRCLDTALEVHTCVRGRGALTDVRLLGGRSLIAGAPLGLMTSWTPSPKLFSPNPEDMLDPIRDARLGTSIGVLGDGEAGRARWCFSPAPLYVALGDETWLDVAVAAPVEELRFVELRWDALAQGFTLVLDYDGQTSADGELRLPALLVTPNVADPYSGLRRHRDDLGARGFAPPAVPRERPEWWNEPIFCGWGAQCWLERTSGGLARDYATQACYDEFLAELEEHGVVPGTVVLDDKWQSTYGANEPDTAKWPDLAAWIASRHERGQRVLLWWKAWDPEGLSPELCVRNPDGVPVAFDPANPAARDELRRIVHRMLGPDGLDADGLKVDFNARTPSGRALEHAGDGWGIALLHELLSVVYTAAKESKPDALVITHTPHPSFVDVTDMIRLNDIMNGDVLTQMAFRADVVRAACPDLPIDTDDWRIPNKRSWRKFLAVKTQIGVPSLYYSSHLDATGEELDDDDYAALRAVWEEWREMGKAA